jgi:AcrR family transcriptional regulator
MAVRVADGGERGEGEELSTRDRILQEAAVLFRERGFAATTMRTIAAASGLTPGALYWHFPSKQDILYAIVLGLSEDWDRTLVEVLAAPTAVERLRRHIRAQLTWELQVTDAGHALLYVHGPEQLKRFLSDEQREYISGRQRAHFVLLEAMLADGIADGSIRPLPVTPAAHAIYDMCSSPPSWWQPGEGLDAARLADIYEDLILRMVLTRSLPEASA